jgi:hypothetical protein
MTAGRFILATNILDKDEMNDGQILEEYKDQQSNERGFGFLCIPVIFHIKCICEKPRESRSNCDDNGSVFISV